MGQVSSGESKSRATIPAVHALHLVDLLVSYNVNESELFEGTELSRELLAAPGTRLDVESVGQLLQRGQALSGRPDLGLQVGLRMRASSHGFLGFALMTAATLGEALELACRYAPTRTDAIGLRVEHRRSEGCVILTLDELVDLGVAREHLLLGLLVGIAQMAIALTGQMLSADVELAMPRPSYAVRAEQLAYGELRFEAPAHRVTIRSEMLEHPLVMADATAQRLAREQCERELGAVGEGSLLESRVRALIPEQGGYGFRSAEEVAKKLGMSTRTFKRRLASHDLRYSDLVDSMRRDRALSLLGKPSLSVDEVAERLGYSDTANFVRAFKRWTGKTPTVYRRDAG